MIVMITFSVASPFFLKKNWIINLEFKSWVAKTFIADSFYVSHLLEFSKTHRHDEEPLPLENVCFWNWSLDEAHTDAPLGWDPPACVFEVQRWGAQHVPLVPRRLLKWDARRYENVNGDSQASRWKWAEEFDDSWISLEANRIPSGADLWNASKTNPWTILLWLLS